jgi:trehalose 6-phosphate synthase/phosphatase
VAHRNADEDFGLWQAKELAVHLQDMAQKLPIDVIHGKKVIEVRPSNINKGIYGLSSATFSPCC